MTVFLIQKALSYLHNSKIEIRNVRSSYLYRHGDDSDLSNRLLRLISLLEIVESDLLDLKKSLEEE